MDHRKSSAQRTFWCKYILFKTHNSEGNTLSIQILSSAALSTFAFPCEIPTNGAYKRFIGLTVILGVGATAALTAGCLSTITNYRY